jgi:quinoprotein glucose dehydrogenase
MGGTLSTAGDLVFAADYYGKLAAYSAANGDVKWSYQLGVGPATPMTYAIGGRQFVAVLSNGQVWAFALTSSSM